MAILRNLFYMNLSWKFWLACFLLLSDAISILGDQEVLSYYLTPNGGNTLCKISYMMKYINPDIMCWPPILEPVIAILLHFLPEDKVYACMMAMLKNKSITYFDQTRVENVTTDATLQDLLKHTNVSIWVLFLRECVLSETDFIHGWTAILRHQVAWKRDWGRKA